jgi:hypothetical protein
VIEIRIAISRNQAKGRQCHDFAWVHASIFDAAQRTAADTALKA